MNPFHVNAVNPLLKGRYSMECALEITLLFTKVSSFYHQLALSQATGDKGPTGPGGFPPDPFQYLQAQVGPVGPRGPPGMYRSQLSFEREIESKSI
jgi:hypothetical protein